MRAITRITALCALVVASTACGFHIRENAALPTVLQPLYIGGKTGNGGMAQALTVELKSNETSVTSNPAAANYQLIILSETHEQRIVSLDQRGLVAEYGLNDGIEFELRDKTGQRVLAPQTIMERRTIVNNPDNVTTTGEEVRIVTEDMVHNLAQQVVRRLSAYANKVKAGTAEPLPAAAQPASH